MIHERNRPWLIQRVVARELKDQTLGKGIDGAFIFDYMGSSEFEWGTLPHSLRLMRAADAGWEPEKLKAGGWYVGPSERLPIAEELVADQRGPMTWRLKERTLLSEGFNAGPRGLRMDGWWAVETTHERGAIPFIVFRDKAHADLWLKLMREKV